MRIGRGRNSFGFALVANRLLEVSNSFAYASRFSSGKIISGCFLATNNRSDVNAISFNDLSEEVETTLPVGNMHYFLLHLISPSFRRFMESKVANRIIEVTVSDLPQSDEAVLCESEKRTWIFLELKILILKFVRRLL